MRAQGKGGGDQRMRKGSGKRGEINVEGHLDLAQLLQLEEMRTFSNELHVFHTEGHEWGNLGNANSPAHDTEWIRLPIYYTNTYTIQKNAIIGFSPC